MDFKPCKCKECELYPCDMPEIVVNKVEQGEEIICEEFLPLNKVTTIREYAENLPVYLVYNDGKLCIKAFNEGGHNCILLDLEDVLNWAWHFRPSSFTGIERLLKLSVVNGLYGKQGD